MPKELFSPIKAVPFQGGIDTRRRVSLLPFGAYSQVQNLRPRRPGFIKRPGQSKLHTTADSTNGVISLYQFKKQKVSEQHFYAQMTDSDVLEATNTPPTTTTGVFGSEAFSGSTTPKPASWAVIQDQLVFANGVDRHQIYGGNSSYVKRAVVYKGTTAITTQDVVEEGFDYSEQVKDTDTSKVVVLDDVGTDTDNYVAFMTPVPAISVTVDIGAVNGNSVTISNVEYAKTDNTWSNVSGLSDGTASGGATLAQDGTISWTAPSDEKPTMLYGEHGYWYKLKFSGALDAEVEINTVTFNSAWTNMINKWNGVAADPFEVWVEFTAANEWSVYAASSVNVGDLPASRRIILFCTDPIDGIYVDVGSTPNSTASGAISTIKYWDGDSFVSVGTFNDGTNNGTNTLANSGWITFPRQTAHPHQFQSSKFNAYVYEITMSAHVLSSDMDIGFQVRPFFDITELGNGNTSSAWLDRMAHSFFKYPEFVYISQSGDPQVLNGVDAGLVKAGDGRQNDIVAMRRFYNELIVWQEEKGIEGGCTTMIQGYSPSTFGKFVLSNKIGAMNSKSVEVIEGVKISTQTDEQIKTVAFWISRYGICASEGRAVWIISDPIQNYFDPTDSNSIRRGYEQQHWLKYDSAYNILRIGLVTGSSATVPNTFLCYDLSDHVFYTDTLGQPLLCMEEVEAASGDVIELQVGGGTADGFIYLLNSGQNDVSTAVDSSITLELDGSGEIMNLHELVLSCQGQAAGNITLDIKENDIAKVSSKTLSMVVQVASQADRRHRIHLNVVGEHISITLSHNTVSEDMYLYDLGVLTTLWKRR